MIDGEGRYARLAAQLLKAQPAAEFPDREGRRDTVVAAMALAIAEKRRRRRTAIAVGAVLAAAAAVLLMVKVTAGNKAAGPFDAMTLSVEEHTGTGCVLVRDALQKPLLDGARLAEGDAIQAQAGSSTTLAFGNGTRVVLSAAGRLHVDELAATRRFSLGAGRLQARVAKLARGERFVVDTPDAEIEVRGTVFGIVVAPASGCGDQASRSTVEVSEGAVWVRSGTRQALLRPGESWTSPCADATSEPEPSPTMDAPPAAEKGPSAHSPRHPVAVPLRHAVAVPSRQPVAVKPSTTSAPPAAPVVSTVPPAVEATPAAVRESHLAEQNGLLSAAMAAEHGGDHATALDKLDQLIRRFPAGPLLESARAERQRILSAQPQR